MNTAEHSVAPEEVMAFLDGELSAADARVMAQHLEQCAECALVAEELRGTSLTLSRWSVPAVPHGVEDVVESKAAGARGWRIFSGRFRTWKIVGLAGGAVIAAMLMVSVLTRSRTNPPSYEEMIGRRPAPTLPPESLASREYTATRDSFQAMEQRKQPAAMSESLVSNGALADRPAPVAGVAGMSGAMGGVMTEKDARNLPAPMIARSVSLAVRVRDVDAARAALDGIIARHRGYAAHLNVNSPEDGARWFRASLRVPESELTSVLGDMRALGRVENEAQSGEEVSQQHADLVARLKTSRETEERFQDILKQRTGNIRDVLEVEQNIARVRGDIEAMEAEQKALEHRVDFATVEVQLSEQYKAQLAPPADSVSTRVHNAFVAGYHNAAETLLGFVLFAEEYGPVLVIWLAVLAIPVLLVWRRYRRIHSSM